MSKFRIALLHQKIEPPVINGIRKPMKIGGYQDSSADIAFSLQSQPGIDVLTAKPSPGPASISGWSFPDTEEGILSALERGATHIWANTILFASHPLQSSPRIGKYQDMVKVIGQAPLMVEKYDDKEFLNNLLRSKGKFTMPRAWSLSRSKDINWHIKSLNLPFPVVAKPIRGRGSHGVKVCHSEAELLAHSETLFEEAPFIMTEEFLAGEEATVSVMPPSAEIPKYWSMPIVTRFNHADGIAPYNGTVAVAYNSRVVSSKEYGEDPAYGEAARQCEEVAQLLEVKAPIRIDIRRFKKDVNSKFALFDINMKPNMTGPGRPGREDQASLTAMSALELGWDYPRLLHAMVQTSSTLKALRDTQLVE